MAKFQSTSAINRIESDLNSMQLTTYTGILQRNADNLFESLNSSKNFFVDQDFINKINKIYNDITIKQQDLINKENEIQHEKNIWEEEISKISWTWGKWSWGRLNQLQSKLSEIEKNLNHIKKTIPFISTRKKEYEGMIQEMNKFDINRDLPEMKSDKYETKADLMKPSESAKEYGLFNEEGNKIDMAKDLWIDITLADGKKENVKIKDLKINTTTGEIDVSKIRFEDRSGKPYTPKEWYEFTLYPGAIIPSGSINFIHSKPLKIVRGTIGSLDTQALREKQVNIYNKTGGNNIVQNAITANYDMLIARLEREAFFKGLEKADDPKFNKLTSEQKEDFYQAVRKSYWENTGIPKKWTGFWRAKDLGNINNFNKGVLSFLERITWEKHESNKPEFTKNETAYKNYIHNNLEDQIKKYFEWRLNKVFSENIDGNMYIKSQLTKYLTDIEKQKIDDDATHTNILHDITPEDEMKSRRRRSIDINERSYGIGRKDKNYLSFFEWSDSKVDIKDQTVNITTNNRPEDLNNEEPIKYDMSMEVRRQQILVNVKIGKQREIKLKGGSPEAIIKRILQCEEIKHGKVRAHVVYNTIKGLIKSAKQKDISLSYRDPNTGNMMVIKMDGDNIVLEQQDNQSNYWNTYKRNTTVLFDHQYFENTNTFDSYMWDDNRKLRVGIDKLMGHFNLAMNELYYQKRQATERRWMGLRRSHNTAQFPVSFRTSPIKKICNIRRNMNFGFTTSINSNGKTAAIELKKNRFTIQMAGLKKPITGKDLWKLLRYRVGGVRIFDGMERDICMGVYKNLIEKMRTNTKIARTSFGVKDPLTGKIYILDEEGKFWYITAEEAERRNPIKKRNAGKIIKKWMIMGGLLAWGVLTWGIISTWLLGLGIVNGVGLWTYVWDHRGKKFGVVKTLPEWMMMCDDSETREIMKNPFLMGRFIKAMNDKL